MYMYQYLESYKQVAKSRQFQITERNNYYMYILSKKKKPDNNWQKKIL